MTIDESIEVLTHHKLHWEHLLEQGICDAHEGKETISAFTIAIAVMIGQDGKIGTWKKETDNTRTWDRVRFYCSMCGDWQTYGETDYCSHCGARMVKADSAVPFNYGYWLKDKDNGFTCDDCGCWVVRPSAYCPDCGREMRVLHPEETE